MNKLPSLYCSSVQRHGILASLLWLVACTTPTLTPLSPRPAPQSSTVRSLPNWQQQDMQDSLRALRQSCKAIGTQPNWQTVCHEANTITLDDNAGIQTFFEQRFTAWQLTDGQTDTGLITGYYEPLLNGSRNQTQQTPYPVYGVPADLWSVELPANWRSQSVWYAQKMGNNRLLVKPTATAAIEIHPADFITDARTQRLKGRLDGNRLVPYYTRAEIAQGKGISTAPILAWVEDPVDLFFLQIQGSGRIQLEDGSFIHIGYADQNGYGYQSIGKWLVSKGELTLANASMQGIKQWIASHPSRQQELFNVNPSYVFFKPLPGTDSGPLGSLGVPLTGGYSIAVDPRFIPLGLPVYLATSMPFSNTPLTRLVHAQDTGGAIKGALRADLFWGYGTEAGMYAGQMRQQGKLWVLLPNGIPPSMLSVR